MTADVNAVPLVKIQSLTLVCLWKSELTHPKHNSSSGYPRGQTNDYFSAKRQWQSCPGLSKSSPAAQRASHSYYILQRDAYVALQGDINASASNMQLVHLPNYPATSTSPPPPAKQSISVAELATCIRPSPIDEARHAWHWYSWWSRRSFRPVVEGIMQKVQSEADLSDWAAPGTRRCPCIVPFSRNQQSDRSVYVCVCVHVSICHRLNMSWCWWRSRRPKYQWLFMNM